MPVGRGYVVMIEIFLVVETEVGVNGFIGVGQCATNSYAVAGRVGRGQNPVTVAGPVAVVGHTVKTSLKRGLVEYADFYRHCIVGKNIIGMACRVGVMGIMLVHVFPLDNPAVVPPCGSESEKVDAVVVGYNGLEPCRQGDIVDGVDCFGCIGEGFDPHVVVGNRSGVERSGIEGKRDMREDIGEFCPYGADVAHLFPDNRAVGKIVVGRAAERVDSERHTELSRLKSQSLGEFKTAPSVEDFHLATVAEVSLHIIVDGGRHVPGDCQSGVPYLKAAGIVVEVHLPPGSYGPVNAGEIIDVIIGNSRKDTDRGQYCGKNSFATESHLSKLLFLINAAKLAITDDVAKSGQEVAMLSEKMFEITIFLSRNKYQVIFGLYHALTYLIVG